MVVGSPCWKPHTYTQTQRYLHCTVSLTWVVRGCGVTLLEASHLYTARQTGTYTVLWVWPGWWGVVGSPCWKPHTYTQPDRQVLTLYCEFDLGGEWLWSHPVGSLTPVHRQSDRYLHCTVSLTWVVSGWRVTLLEASHLYTHRQTGTYTVLWVWPGWWVVGESPCWKPHTCTHIDRQVLTLYCEFDLGGEWLGGHPVGSLTPVHTQTDRYLHCTVSLTWVVNGCGVTLLEASHLYTYRQTDRQVLTLYCEFDLGGEWLGSHPVGSLTPIHRQTDRYLHCTVSLTWVVKGCGVTLLEASHLYTARQTGTYTVLWVWPGWWVVGESPCWKPHTCTQTVRQVLTLYCEFDLGGEWLGSHPVGSLTPVHRQTDRYLHCTVSLTWVVRGCGSHPVGSLTPIHSTDRQVLTLYCEFDLGGEGCVGSPCWKPHTYTQTDRQVLTLHCEFDLGGEWLGSHPIGSLTPVHRHRQTDRYLHCTVSLTWVVSGCGVTLLEVSHLYTDRQTDRYLHCTVSLTWVVRGWGVTLLEASHLYTDRQTGTYTVLWVWPGWWVVGESPCWKPHTYTHTDRQVLTLYCEFDLGGEGLGSHPVGSLTPVHRQTDRQVLTLYCEFDLGGEWLWSHPVGSLTPIHRQTDRQTGTYTVLWVWPGWWVAVESPCWKPHTCTQTQTDRQVLTLYCEFDLGGEWLWSHPVGSLTPVHRHRQTDRYLHCTVSLTWVVRGCGVTLLEASHLYTPTDRQVLTLHCEFDLGGEWLWSHPIGRLTPIDSLVVVWSDGEDEFILRFAEAALVREVYLLVVLVPEVEIGERC